MPDEFDPYLAWLGIPTTARPASHYQLLGLPELESDGARIIAAADERMAEVRKYQTGPRGKYTQNILNELASAKLCLLDARSKADYDAGLVRQRTAMPVQQPVAVVYVPIEAPPPAAPPSTPPPVAPPSAAKAVRTSATTSPVEHEEETRESNGAWLIAGIFFVIIIAVAGVAVYSLPKKAAPPPSQAADETEPISPPEKKAVRIDPQTVPLVILQEGNGDLSFPASVAELSEGLQRREEAGESLIEGWRADASVARWRFKIIRPAVFQVRIVYSAQQAGEAQWQLRVGDDVKSRELRSSSQEEPFVSDEFFWRIARGGENTFEISLTSLPEDAPVILKSVRFIFQPGGKLQ